MTRLLRYCVTGLLLVSVAARAQQAEPAPARPITGRSQLLTYPRLRPIP
ncbi:hypothetical protein ACFQT0_30540 [Hymenobacter humi]|uniref:Uncharacterized protein n=1 Tax=Hymenobacter humi TaxID=1411620 RepID=A0ABW2UFQ3_9BACT